LTALILEERRFIYIYSVGRPLPPPRCISNPLLKWVNHKIAGLSVSLLLGFKPLGVVIATASSVVPDTIELGIFKHRGISHAWWLYVLIFGATYVLFPVSHAYIFYFVIGVFLHILCDACTYSGVPVGIGDKRRFALRLFRTGSAVEYIISAAFLFTALYFVLKRGWIFG